ncbi:MAG: GWxTD domain-containing protein [Bacteroidota bacterium]|nr:GWxTD domain-containing protein [Bacteroidota bacterium]MDP4234306.1 GWxTD domain-containing protein [Bacteroidota bacterium]MDP4243240.1 GWxTD domain-containing protein [Bacteroidota bacterium]MDP4288053.1 GWxTD domain-containing protein [Bacteroidota bacterium]
MMKLGNALLLASLAALPALALAPHALAQSGGHGYGSHSRMHAHDSRQYFDYGNPLMSSVLQSADGRALDVRLATASSMFSFLRSGDAARGAYYAIRDVTVLVTEEGNAQPVISRDRIDTIYVRTFEQSTAKNDWHTADLHMDIPNLNPKMRYAVRIEVRDDIDHLMMAPITTPLLARAYTNTPDSNGIGIGDLMLIDNMSGSEATASAHGNTYMFSRDVIASVPIQIADTLHGAPSVDVRVRQIANAINPSDTGDRGHVMLTAADLRKDQTFEFKSAGSTLTYALVPQAGKGTWTALMTIPGQKFDQGKYEITVRVQAGAAERERTSTAMIVWQGMPLSLEDPADAIEPLTHILSKEQATEIASGSKQEQVQKLYAYWKTQDPTPGTAYNERMAAFYQRVDYADFNFATSRLLNGVMTDRGKIYLLYGAPSNVDRTFVPGESPVETWTYSNNVGRIFRFEDPGHRGEYRLTNIENLALKQ